MTPEQHEVKNESQNSFEFGSTKCRHKVYYWTPEELEAKLKVIEATLNEPWITNIVEKANTTK